MKVVGSTETLGLLKTLYIYFYTILTRVTFLFLNMFPSPGYRTIFKTISEKYDKDTLQKARSFNKIMLKTARHRRHLHFNHRCKDLQVLPTSLRIKPPVRTPKGWKLTKNMGFQFLKLRIEETHKKIRSLTREKELALDFLRSRLTTCDFKHLKTFVHEQQQEEYGRIRSLHSKKLQALTSKLNVSSPDTVNRDKWVLDISSKQAGTKVGPDQLGPPVRVGSTRIDSDRLGS